MLATLITFSLASVGLMLFGPTAAAAPAPVERGLINIETTTQTVTEGNNIELTLTRTGGTDGLIEFLVVPVGGTATSNLDYADFSIPGIFADTDDTPINITIPTFADPTAEDDETITIQVIATAPITLDNTAGPNNQTTITITETPVAPTPGPTVTPTATPGPVPTATPGPAPTATPGPAPTPDPTPAPSGRTRLPITPVPTPTPDPVVGPIVAAAITVEVHAGTAIVDIPGALGVWISSDERVVLKAAGNIVFDGTLPADGEISVPWADDAVGTLTFNSRLTNGAPYTEHVTVAGAAASDGAPSAAAKRSTKPLATQGSLAATTSPASSGGSSVPLTPAIALLATIAAGATAAQRRRTPTEF